MRTVAKRPDIMNELSQVHLPVGFRLDDLHTMTNLDGDGDVSEQEFVDCISRLIFCDDFQSKCLVHLAMGHIKSLLVEVKRFNDMLLNVSIVKMDRDVET